MAKQTVGEFLATLRRANGYTQQEVADRLGISNRTLSAWERDTSAPDILLLPALADLYGVTVDEILRGERKAVEEKPISSPSQARLLKGRLARFTMQTYILTGILALGLLLFFIGWFFDVVTTAWVGWQWWILMLWLGLGMVVICSATLLALWKGAELSADEDQEHYGAYCMLLRKKVAACAYLSAALSFAFCVVSAIALWERSYFLMFVFVFLPLAILFYAFGFALTRSALKRWGGERGAAYLKGDGGRMKKLARYGLIPLAVAIVAIWATNVFTFPVAEFPLVQADTREEFTRKMETIALSDGGHLWDYEEAIVEKGEYYLALSEAAERATPDEPIELFRGVTATFNEDKSECTVEVIYRVNAEGIPTSTSYYYLHRIDIEEGYHVYDLALRNSSHDYTNAYMPPLARYAGISTHYRTGNGYAVMHTVRAEYTELGALIAVLLLGGDILVCFAVFYTKREKYEIKL